MKTFVLCLLVRLSLTQMTTILLSDESVMTVVSPSGYHATNNNFLNNYMPDKLRNGAKWVFLNGSNDFWPDVNATFHTSFYTNCSSVGQVTITADNQYLYYLNGQRGGFGYSVEVISIFKVQLKCGHNNFTVHTSNLYTTSPSGVVFSISQDISQCESMTQCKDDCNANALAYFDKETSKCECSIECACPSEKHWLGYPDCGCKCNQETNCQSYQYFDKKTCSCKCNSVLTCPSGQTFDQSTCSCVSSCQDKCCPLDTHLDTSSCDCVPDPNTI